MFSFSNQQNHHELKNGQKVALYRPQVVSRLYTLDHFLRSNAWDNQATGHDVSPCGSVNTIYWYTHMCHGSKVWALGHSAAGMGEQMNEWLTIPNFNHHKVQKTHNENIVFFVG